jgi:septum site-determining protein MinC
MDAAVSNDNADLRPPALLRGTAKGLEIHVNGLATVDEILASVITRLDEAPTFFRGCDVRIRVDDGPLPAGCLGRLDEVALKFELRIVEVGAAKKDKLRIVDADGDGVPKPNLAAGSAPSPAQLEPPPLQPPDAEALESFDEYPTGQAVNPLAALLAPLPQILADNIRISEPVMLADSELTELVDVLRSEQINFDEPTQTAVPIALAASAESELEPTAGTRLVVGPVRSGVILEHHGHLIIFGDVNPGAEVRAEGNIVVLGRLRGTAHAGIGQDVGFILALRLEPQQLRVGRKVARAADSDTAPSEAEIAYCTGDQIVVERYSGKLPRNLATSI